MSQASRSALLDCTKGLACAAIVWHHLAFYGPMSDVARAEIPELIDWLYEYARMAVQIFLVLGGYLAAASLAPQGQARFDAPWLRIGRRFVRLIVPYAVALVVVMLVSEVVRPWFDHESISAEPDLWQLITHALLLQGIAGEESLSAGVWYVSIDFQLFALTVLLLVLARGLSHRPAAWPPGWTLSQLLVVLLAAASLLGFNRDADWDDWALYFFGAYGLGMMACWAVQAPKRAAAWAWSLLMVGLVMLALALQWRDRIALAGATALALVAAMRSPSLAQWQGWRPLGRLGQISYSVFLVHFAVCLLMNAVVHYFWPDSVVAALWGMPIAFVLSIAAGYGLYERVERPVSTWQVALRWQAGLVGAGMLAAAVAALH
ncbi:acyltransferase family protein [Comamonas composti]|uniref:acyltransferase family protein n=1 Tax=Comamonas composti TaxID=408558 RepID=UPI000416BE2C|nr:acyltransferase [Comamonas composti]